MIRVLIGDDHPIVRAGLRGLLGDSAEDIVVAGEAEDGQQVLDMVAKNTFDVVLLDISMPGRGGLEVLHQLRTEKRRLPILMLSMYSEEQYALRALKAGASGYLTKASAPSELAGAIRKVASGGKYVSASLAERLASCLGESEALHEGLSDREYQVLCLIAAGKPVGVIAQDLALSVKTVSTYRTRVLEKMHMKSNAELTRYALRNNLVD